MATKEELYLSIDTRNYIKNKSSLLRCQEDMLKAMKHLYNIKVLTRLKNDLREEFQKLAGSVNEKIKEIQGDMPSSGLPKNMRHKSIEEDTPAEEEEKPEEVLSETWDIESELRTIQEKLNQLNA
jgi:hypothetical protein